MSYHPAHEKRALMHALAPGFRATARRYTPVLEEFSADLGAGREVVFLVIPPPRVPVPCQWCFGQRKLWEPSALGLCPVLCGRCYGTGVDP